MSIVETKRTLRIVRPDSRNRAVCASRDQGGFMLLLVLGMILVIGVLGVAVLAMTATAGNVSRGLSRTTATVRDVDGALENAVNVARRDLTGCPTPGAAGAVSVACADNSTATDIANGIREMTFTAKYGSSAGSLAGQASVKVIDVVNNEPQVGFSLQVCDWQLGKAISATLNACF